MGRHKKKNHKNNFFHFRQFTKDDTGYPYKFTVCGIKIGRTNQDTSLPVCPACYTKIEDRRLNSIFEPYSNTKKRAKKIIVQKFAPVMKF